jgi:hypothetical protein
LGLLACGGGGDDAGGGGTKTPNDVKTTSASAAAITAFAKRDDSQKVDKVGVMASFKPDGKNDAAFDVTVKGPLIALLIDAADDSQWQWDTYTGQNDVPKDMKAFAPGGAQTGDLGIFEGDKNLNAADGSFKLDDDKEHKLSIYIVDTGAFSAGAKFKILGETPDHKVVEGPTITY